MVKSVSAGIHSPPSAEPAPWASMLSAVLQHGYGAKPLSVPAQREGEAHRPAAPKATTLGCSVAKRFRRAGAWEAG